VLKAGQLFVFHHEGQRPPFCFVFEPPFCLVFYPLAFERSDYLHPIFEEFIDLYTRSCSPKHTQTKELQLIFSVAFAITFTTHCILFEGC